MLIVERIYFTISASQTLQFQETRLHTYLLFLNYLHELYTQNILLRQLFFYFLRVINLSTKLIMVIIYSVEQLNLNLLSKYVLEIVSETNLLKKISFNPLIYFKDGIFNTAGFIKIIEHSFVFF